MPLLEKYVSNPHQTLCPHPKILSGLFLENLYTHVHTKWRHKVLPLSLRTYTTLHTFSWAYIHFALVLLWPFQWKYLVCQTSTLLGALASNIHRCLSYMCRLSWITVMALTFCGKKSEVGASVSYGHISSFFIKIIIYVLHVSQKSACYYFQCTLYILWFL